MREAGKPCPKIGECSAGARGPNQERAGGGEGDSGACQDGRCDRGRRGEISGGGGGAGAETRGKCGDEPSRGAGDGAAVGNAGRGGAGAGIDRLGEGAREPGGRAGTGERERPRTTEADETIFGDLNGRKGRAGGRAVEDPSCLGDGEARAGCVGGVGSGRERAVENSSQGARKRDPTHGAAPQGTG